jgi:hypothetical protein
MAGKADPFQGVSNAALRRRLVEAGDRRLDALSVAASQEARRDQAVLVSELQRRGAPLEEPGATLPTPDTSGQGGGRPALLPPGLRQVRPEDRTVSETGRATPDHGAPL